MNIPGIISGSMLSDILFNSIYRVFERSNKLVLWAILVSVEFILVDAFLRISTFPFYMPLQYTVTFFNVTLLLLPVIILEASAGGYIGHKIYLRIKKGLKL